MMKSLSSLWAGLVLCFLPASLCAQHFAPETRMLIESAGTPAAAQLQPKSLSLSPTYSALIKVSSQEGVENLRAQGVEVQSVVGNIVSCRMPLHVMAGLHDVQGVDYIRVGQKVHKLNKETRQKVNVDKVHLNEGGALPHEYKGKGVVVGIIDNGFEFSHPAFFAPDGTYRVKRVWMQTSEVGTPPRGYSYGTELATAAEIQSALTDDRNDTHGTHVAGIAAGSDMSVPYYGMAPESEIVLVAFDDDDASILDGAKYIVDYAKSVGKPCVINASLGSHLGPHDGSSLLDQGLDVLTANPGCLFVGAVGNEGDVNLHARKTLTASDRTFKSMIGYEDPSYMGAMVDIWGPKAQEGEYTIQGVVVDVLKGAVVYSTEELPASALEEGYVEATLRSTTCGADGYIVIGSEIAEFNGKVHFRIATECEYLSSNRKIGFIVKGPAGATLDAWNDSYGALLSGSKLGWSAGNASCSCGEIGGTGKGVISAGSYHLASSYIALDGYERSAAIDDEEGALSCFSSFGPTLDGRMKPEICAPGMLVTSAVSSYTSFPSTCSAKVSFKGRTYYYGPNGGTSMASPVVAGTLALWLQADPTLTHEQVRSVFAETSIADEFTAATPSAKWGYGKLDAYAGLAKVLQNVVGIDRISTSDASASSLALHARLTSSDLQVRFSENVGATRLNLYTSDGRALLSTQLPETHAADVHHFSLPALPAGLYLLRAEAETGTTTLKLFIK